MSFVAYLLLMLFGTALSWGAWVLVLQSVNPDESGIVGFVMFYLTLIMALIGTLSLIELLLRKAFGRERLVLARDVRTSFRHGVLLSLITALSLGLTAQGWFTWWVLLIMLAVAGLIEYLSLVVQEARRG